MGLLDDVRAHAAEVAATARFVTIDEAALAPCRPGRGPAARPRDVLDRRAARGGRPLGPDLGQRELRLGLVSDDPQAARALGLADDLLGARRPGPRRGASWTAAELRALTVGEVAATLGQDPAHELMALYARALNDLGAWLGDRAGAEPRSPATAEGLATELAAGMPLFDDAGFYKRAQIAAADLALAGVATFGDLDRLTIFADNLVPHVLRVRRRAGLRPGLAARIDAGELLRPARGRRSRSAAAPSTPASGSPRGLGAPRRLDNRLWWRGQARVKAVPRHRTRTVFY